MYIPPAFREDDRETLRALIREARLCTFVTATADGLMATPLPMFLDPTEGDHGALYGHVARANSQWKVPPLGDALAIFLGPHAYVSPSWYATKQENGKVVPTWNYAAVHVHGPVEFFEDPDRLLQVVSRLTDLNEKTRAEPWSVSDAPPEYIKAQLNGIIGIRMAIKRIEGKRKMSQNRGAQDRKNVAAQLAVSDREMDRAVARLIPPECRSDS